MDVKQISKSVTKTNNDLYRLYHTISIALVSYYHEKNYVWLRKPDPLATIHAHTNLRKYSSRSYERFDRIVANIGLDAQCYIGSCIDHVMLETERRRRRIVVSLSPL